jgi:hypothetical protein
MSDKIRRKRKVDIQNLPEDQLEQLTQQISNKMKKLIDETCGKANKILDVYGLKAKMTLVILDKNSVEDNKE